MNIIMYDKDGQQTSNEDLAWTKEGKYFYVKCSNSRLINPYEYKNVNNKKLKLSWFKVTQQVFLNYMKFLRSKRQLFLTQAQRGI